MMRNIIKTWFLHYIQLLTLPALHTDTNELLDIFQFASTNHNDKEALRTVQNLYQSDGVFPLGCGQGLNSLSLQSKMIFICS